jgi:hypothetical protein
MNQGSGNCSGCGAQLPPFMESDGGVRCGACGLSNTATAPPTFGVPAGGYGAPPGGFGVPPGGYGGAPGPFGPPGTVAPKGGYGVAGVLVVLGLVAVIIGGAGFAAFAVHRGKSATGWPTGAAGLGGGGSSGAVPSWEGIHGVILTDINGDGVPDVVGRVRYVSNGDKVHLAAFEGASGKKLWEGEALGTYSDTYQGPMGLADDTLIIGRANGEISGWGVRDGKKRWTGTVPEKTVHFCKGEHAGEVRVVLADQTSVVLRLADGHASAPVALPKPAPFVMPRPTSLASAKSAATATPVPKPGETCVPIWSDGHPNGDPSFESRNGEDPRIDGMRASFVMQRSGGPKIVIGTRAKGTAVPMIAAVYADPSHDWKSDLPGSRPLETSVMGTPCATLTANRVFTEYGFASGGSTPHEVVAFDLTGRRLWEAPLPTDMPLSAIDSDDHRVFVSQWSHLTVFDAATGKVVYVIGAK